MQNDLFFQKYKYIKALGKGGCGEVFLAENIILGNYWAVKEIPKDRITAISGYIEPEILKRLNHPALPRICDVYEDEAKIYIIEDYIEGVCLQQELELKGRFDEQKTIEIGLQLCNVLDYLHGRKPNPIIYGDMKPHNIILTKDGFVKLVDFGVSLILDDASNPKTGRTPAETTFIGTKGYAAPEQYSGAHISPSTDIYSLGITLIQLISGIDPLKSLQSYYNSGYGEYMSPGLFTVLQKCIQASPGLRYQNAVQLMKELQEVRLNNVNRPPGIAYIKSNSCFARIFALSGVAGTGVSTITAAMAEFMARTSQTACIVDLSVNCTLEKSLAIKKAANSAEPSNISSNLYYINLSALCTKFKTYPDDHTDPLILYKQFSKLQDQFSFIFIDADVSILKFIEQFVNHIFLVCDMNPYSMAGLGNRLAAEALASGFVSGTSFIINKFYAGELSPRNLLQSIFQSKDNEDYLQKLISLSKHFEVPYDQRIYLRWMYSGFGEPLKFGSLSSDSFRKAISGIASEIVQAPKKGPQAKIKQFLKGRKK